MLYLGGKGSKYEWLASKPASVDPDSLLSRSMQDLLTHDQSRVQYIVLVPYSFSAKTPLQCFAIDPQSNLEISDGDVIDFEIKAKGSDDSYLNAVEKIKNEILEGRFYQLNLLRYFEVNAVPLDLLRKRIVPTLRKRGGPYSLYLEHDYGTLVSFSPERFVSVTVGPNALNVTTYPIKGTAKVDDHNRTTSADKLLSSEKDRAELNMIIDLMRNDLNRVCKPNTVKVESDSLVSDAFQLKHLYAKVRGELTSLTFGEFIFSLCPAGSITGAPKLEVMKAIHEYERRDRGYFMGTCFFIDPVRRTMDSSVLIRTLSRESDQDNFEYAAGSGITLRSDPVLEMEEIKAKCAVVTGK